jgi:hypothetical protein
MRQPDSGDVHLNVAYALPGKIAQTESAADRDEQGKSRYGEPAGSRSTG